MMLKAITFDFWGTLVDAHINQRPERAELLARYLPGVTPEQVKAAYAKSWDDFSKGLDMGLGLTPATIFAGTLDYLGVSLPPPNFQAALRAWEEMMLDHPPPFLPGALDVLCTLRRQGYLIALISDTGTSPGRVIRQMLHRAGALTLFDWLTFSNETGLTKRRPQAFMRTLKALGTAPEQTLHVGDLPETDIHGAHRAGLFAALVLECSQRRDGIADADLVIEYLYELPERLTNWKPNVVRPRAAE